MLACDRTDRSGSEKIIFALTGAYTVNPDPNIPDSLWGSQVLWVLVGWSDLVSTGS